MAVLKVHVVPKGVYPQEKSWEIKKYNCQKNMSEAVAVQLEIKVLLGENTSIIQCRC